MKVFEPPRLSKGIFDGLQNEKIMRLIKQTLQEDLQTIKTPDPNELAALTLSRLIEAGERYPLAARTLALEIYPNWKGKDVRALYHTYNWAVERTGSAENAASYIQGNSLLDIGGGPGTFSLEVLKKRPELQITVADIYDWRNDEAKSHPSIHYQELTIGEKFSVQDKAYDTGSLLYVLHHVETDHEEFLKECARCLRSTLILFEDVMIDPDRETPKGTYRPARSLEKEFLNLSLSEQSQFISVVDYICNHIASRELSMPVPGKYYKFTELKDMLMRIFPGAEVRAHYHGIYDTKCYPNPEAMYVVNFNKGARS